MNSPIMHIVCVVCWLIVSLAAINIGLMPFGYDFFASPFVTNNLSNFITPMYYIIGIAGAVSLVMLVMKLMGLGCCSNKSCN